MAPFAAQSSREPYPPGFKGALCGSGRFSEKNRQNFTDRKTSWRGSGRAREAVGGRQRAFCAHTQRRRKASAHRLMPAIQAYRFSLISSSSISSAVVMILEEAE